MATFPNCHLILFFFFVCLDHHLILAQDQQASQPSTEPSIQVRLAGDKRKHNEGRAEVYYNGQWGTICDDDFSIHSANVFCRQLGYVEATSWFPGSRYGKGEGPIWLDNLYCTGRETSIAQCTSNGWGVSDCKHTEDVSVVCSEKRIPGFKFEDPLLNQIEFRTPEQLEQ